MSNADEGPRNPEIRPLVAARAYEMWENQGRPHGCDLIHWRQAEQDVMSCVPDAKETEPKPRPQRQRAKK